MKLAKKILSVALVMLIVLSFAGCGNSAVKEELCGEWGYVVYSIDGPCYKIYTFDDNNTFEAQWINVNAPSKSSESEGTYKIKGSEIVLTDSEGDVYTIIEFEFDDEELELEDKNSDGSGDHDLIRVD